MNVICPNCGEKDGWEIRGSRRVYARLTEDLEIDGWSEADPDWIEWDTFEAKDPEPTGRECIYCLHCDSAFTKEELLSSDSNRE